MISRRDLFAAASAASLVGGGIALALATSFRGSASRPQLERAPDFSVTAIDGGSRRQLADFAGHVLLLNFWATWCAPCRVEMPWLVRTYERYRLEGLSILGVNMDDGDMPNVQRFAHEMGVTYPIARNNDAIIAAYGGVRFLPQSVLIGRRGEILQRSFGMPSTNAFEMAIVRALSQT